MVPPRGALKFKDYYSLCHARDQLKLKGLLRPESGDVVGGLPAQVVCDPETLSYPLDITDLNLERARRFERPTPTLARLCSTPELRPRSVGARTPRDQEGGL
jgi:hypothetical protein